MLKTINGGKLPTRGTKYSACVDLYAREDVTIYAGETKLIPLGICIDENELQKAILRDFGQPVNYLDEFCLSHYLQLMLRSSLSKDLIIANGVGVVDLDYKDEIMIRVHKPFDGTFDKTYWKDVWEDINKKTVIKKYDRVAQITLLEHKSYLFGIESEEERTGGFGSTGGA